MVGESQTWHAIKGSAGAGIKLIDWLGGKLFGIPWAVIEWATDTTDKSLNMASNVGQNVVVGTVGGAT